MTITIRKLHLAIAVLAVALIAPATALATHVFVDVDDARFYAEAVEWAKDNDITTGSPAGSDTFKPEDPVTRGENVTFAKRYDDNIVQPGLDALEGAIGGNTSAIATNTSAIATNTAAVAALDPAALEARVTALETLNAGTRLDTLEALNAESRIAALETGQPFAITNFADDPGNITTTPTAVVSVAVTAPVAGHVTLNSTAKLFHSGSNNSDVVCVLAESTEDLGTNIGHSRESAQWMEIDTNSDEASVAGTRAFAIAAGATVTYVLACEELLSDGGYVDGANLTAIFTPAP